MCSRLNGHSLGTSQPSSSLHTPRRHDVVSLGLLALRHCFIFYIVRGFAKKEIPSACNKCRPCESRDGPVSMLSPANESTERQQETPLSRGLKSARLRA